MLCASLLAYGNAATYAQSVPQDASSTGQTASVVPNDQLDSLVAPIALYPDPLLAQVLAASTYPLELVQLQQWLAKNPGLKDQQLTDAVQEQDWDPSVQAMSVFPDLVKQLVENIKWTTELGNAFLAQQSDVMDAVQRMRMKAERAGNLKSSEQQKVETTVVEGKTVVIIQQANPQIVYVPSYNPVVVYGPPIYPYPPIYYPPPSYYATGMVIAFGIGVAMGSYYHGGWGWGCGWGHSNVNINVNNNYVSRRTNINTGNINTGNINRGNINTGNRPSTLPAGGNSWQHNPQHRGGVPYPDQSVANKFGGTARGDSLATRQANARQLQTGQASQQLPNRGAGGANASTRPGGAGGGNMGGGGGNMGAGQARQGAQQMPGSMNHGAGSAGSMGASSGAAGNRVGNRQVPGGSDRGSAFGGAAGGSGSAARASSQRGASSASGARGGGGGSRRR